MAKKLVVLESPYAGTPEEVKINLAYGRACMKDSLLRGESPIASHLLYTQEGVLDDTIPEERKLGIDAGHSWFAVVDLVVVYTDLGIRDGMFQGMNRAYDFGVEVVQRKLTNWVV